MACKAFTAVQNVRRLSQAVSVSSSYYHTRHAGTAFASAVQRPCPGNLASIITQPSRFKLLSSLCTANMFAPRRAIRPVIGARPSSGRSIHTSTLAELHNMPHVDTLVMLCKAIEVSHALAIASLIGVTAPYVIDKPAGKWTRMGFLSLPVIIFIVIMGMGLEQAPNSGRWRRVFLNTSNPKAADENKASIQKWLKGMDPVRDSQDDRVRLVRHVMKNLLKAIQSDGNSLKPFLCDKVMETSGITSDRADQSSLTTVNKRSINVHVSKQLDINAFAMLTQDIAISSGMLEFIDFDEDLTAAVLAHELAHIIQDHSREPHSLRDLLIYGIQWSLWGMHMHLGPSMSCLPMAFASTTRATVVKNPMKQALEIEADTISLKIMALAGYDPIHAARFYDKFAALDEKILLSSAPTKKSQDSSTTTMTTTKTAPETLDEVMEQQNQRLMAYAQRRWYHSTHPSSRLRQQYLTAAMHEVREKFRISEELRSQPIERFCALVENQGVLSVRMGELKARVKTVLYCIRDVLVADTV